MLFTDVFLTTIKPLDKIVRAEDVQSSLYYIHADSEQDEELRQEEEAKLEIHEDGLLHERTEEQFGTPAVRRKPLPQQLYSASGIRLEPPPKTLSHYQPLPLGARDITRLGRKPVSSEQRAAHRSLDATPALPPRKVLGPRPMQERLHSSDSAPLGSVPQRQNIDIRRWSEQRSLEVVRSSQSPYKEKLRELERTYSANFAPLNPITDSRLDPSPSTTLPCTAGSTTGESPCLTLIRRYDENQSNVGRMTSDAESTGLGVGVLLNILSPGYSKYDKQALQGSQERQATNNANTSSEDATFRCILQNKNGTQRPLREIRPGSYQSSLPHHAMRRSQDLQRQGQYRSDDLLRPEMTDEKSNGAEPTDLTHHVFATPWNGTCEFTTGIAGRSLKCKHTLLGDGRAGSSASIVSELRFNLPSSQALRSSRKNSQPGTPSESKRLSFFSKHHLHHSSTFSEVPNGPRSSVSVPEDLDEDRLDLSLGQEHAGGGFGGKQAKLGKLIIEPDGLQMLDLLVAANMVMWWKVYDRFT